MTIHTLAQLEDKYSSKIEVELDTCLGDSHVSIEVSDDYDEYFRAYLDAETVTKLIAALTVGAMVLNGVYTADDLTGDILT